MNKKSDSIYIIQTVSPVAIIEVMDYVEGKAYENDDEFVCDFKSLDQQCEKMVLKIKYLQTESIELKQKLLMRAWRWFVSYKQSENNIMMHG